MIVQAIPAAIPDKSQTQAQVQTTPQPPLPASVPGAVNSPMPGNQLRDIHDIRQPRQVGVNPAIYYWIVGGLGTVIIIGLILFLLKLWFLRKKESPTQVEASVCEEPWLEAERRLDELAREKDILPVEYYFILSAICRGYLKRQFAVEALEMTTEELLPRLSSLELERASLAGLKELLFFGDQVKFAQASCQEEYMKKHLDLVRDLVRTTSGQADTDKDIDKARE